MTAQRLINTEAMNEDDQWQKRRHIAVLAFPFGTHAAPLLSLVRRISAEAPEATFYFFSTAKSNASLSFSSSSDCAIRPCTVDDGLPENYSLSGNPQEPVELFLKATPGNFRKAMEDLGTGFSSIISDAFFWFAEEIAREMEVANWFPVWTAGPRSLLCHLETNRIRETMKHLLTTAGGSDDEESTIVKVIPEMPELRACDIPRELLSKSSGFPTMLYNMGLTLPKSTALLANSFEELDPYVVNLLKSRLCSFLNIGPFVLTSPHPSTIVSDPQGCLEWLDNQQQPHSVVYISFGSIISPPPHEIDALAKALEATGFSFIWSFRGNPQEQMPDGFLERTKEKGKVVSWAPQVEVLKHKSTGVFVTHSGWNSLLESIVSGVPLICRPFFGDQQLNTRTVEVVWGIGTGFVGGKISKDGIVEALRMILTANEGNEMRKKINALKEVALNAVKPNGSSTYNFKTCVEMITS